MQPLVAQVNLNFDLPDGPLFEWLLIVAIVCFVFWLVELISLLKRQDMKDVDKIVWVIVLCALNFLGAVLYWFLAPVDKQAIKRSAIRSEKELKDYCNSYSRYTRPEE